MGPRIRVLALGGALLLLGGCAVTQPAAPTDLTGINASIATLKAQVAAIPPPVDLTPINAAVAAIQAQDVTFSADLTALEQSYAAAAVALAPLTLQAITLDLTVGVPVQFSAGILNGLPPYTAIATGLPDGFTINASGTLFGAATTVGMGVVTVTVMDSTGATATVQQPWTVSAPTSP